MYIKNYFLIGPRIIFRGIANLFFGLQCIAGLKLTAKTVDEDPASCKRCKADLKQRVLFFHNNIIFRLAMPVFFRFTDVIACGPYI